MGDNRTAAFANVANINIADILGLWEVIRINRKDEIPAYPWITGRFKFNFLDEMLFLLTKDGQHSHGTWELTEKAFETKIKRFGKMKYGSKKGTKCKCVSCAEAKECIRAYAATWSGTWRYPGRNCHTFQRRALKKCCLKKGTRII